MKFQKQFNQEIIPEWRDYYFNYEYLCSILNTVRPIYKKYKAAAAAYVLEEEEKLDVAEARDSFHVAIATEMQKFNGFFKYTYNQSVKKKLVQLNYNAMEYATMAPGRTKEFYMHSIKTATEKYYREVAMFRDFFNLNIKAVSVITKRYKKYFTTLQCYDSQFVRMFYKRLLHTFAYKSAPELEKCLTATQNIYLDQVYPDDPRGGLEALRRILSHAQFTTTQAQTIGFFLGVIALALVIIVMLLVENQFFDVDQTNPRSKEFVNAIFPVFRGQLLLFLNIFSWGVVVYIWNKYNINYRRLLRIQMDYSSPYQIMMRSFFFLTVWAVCFLYSCFSVTSTTNTLRNFFSYNVGIYAPVVPSVVFLVYMLWPVRGWFNSSGRAWFAHVLLIDMIITPFYRSQFFFSYVSSNVGNYSLIQRDFAYTVCYFVNVVQSGRATNTCLKQTWYLVVEILIVLSSRVSRMLYAVSNLMWASEADFPRMAYSVVYYAMYFVTIAFNYIQRIPAAADTFLILWLISLGINMVTKYHREICWDFRLLQFEKKNPWLRPHLAFPWRGVYYIVIVVYIILLAAQMISSSPIDVFRIPIIRIMVVTVAGVLNTVRQSIWNIFRMEVQHLTLFSYDKSEAEIFSIIEDFALPNKYLVDADSRSPAVKLAIREGYEQAISKMKDEEFLLDTDVNYKVFLKRFSKLEDAELGGLNKSMDAMGINEQRKLYNKSIEAELGKAEEKKTRVKKALQTEVKYEKNQLAQYESESEEEDRNVKPLQRKDAKKDPLADASFQSEHLFEHVASDRRVAVPNPASLSHFRRPDTFFPAEVDKKLNTTFDEAREPPRDSQPIEDGRLESLAPLDRAATREVPGMGSGNSGQPASKNQPPNDQL